MENMIDEVCAYLNNWFVKPENIHRGKFEITDGSLSPHTSILLSNGQYFRIRRSVFNDGVYQYPASDLVDESFTGEIWAMSVPPAFIALLSDIEAWQARYGTATSVNMSPFMSESFNNYSYSKRSGSGAGGNGQAPQTWKDAFGSRLVRWRKL